MFTFINGYKALFIPEYSSSQYIPYYQLSINSYVNLGTIAIYGVLYLDYIWILLGLYWDYGRITDDYIIDDRSLILFGL